MAPDGLLPLGTIGKWPKEPASNGAPYTKTLFDNKAKGSLSSGLLIQVPDEEQSTWRRPGKTPAICARRPNYTCKWRGR
jgi:hypothetical protein